MSVIYSNAVRTARGDCVNTALGASAVLVIGDSTLNGATGVLASIPLDPTPFNNANGVLTVKNPPRTVNASGAGNAAKAEFRSGTGVVVISGLTVGTSGTDVIINAVSISIGQSVQCTVGTINPTS